MTAWAVILLLSQAAADSPPPCKNGAETCKPWERDWSRSENPFAEYVQTPDTKLGPGPHTLVISDRDGMTRTALIVCLQKIQSPCFSCLLG